MTESEIQSTDGQVLARRITRRVFLRNMSVTAVAIAATACGGGSAASGATEVTEAVAGTSSALAQQNQRAPAVETAAANSAPVWSEIPTITFAQGVASTFSIAAFVSDDDVEALTILKNELALPPGVIYDPAIKSFVYDGVGSVGATSGHVLAAMEG